MKILELFVLVLLSLYAAPEVDGANRMFGSQIVGPGQFPQLVRIRMLYKKTNVKKEDWGWCSAVLIANTWVLTAAHCVKDNGIQARRIICIMGSNRLKQNEFNVTVPFPDINGTIYPVKFNLTGQLQHDIALLRIPRVNTSNTVKFAPLPSLKYFRDNKYLMNKTVYTIGWGNLNDTEDNRNFARYDEFTVVPLRICHQELGVQLFESLLCLKSNKRASACPGDSGGPTILKETGELVGITSFGSETCTLGQPFLVTHINFYTQWIKNKAGIFNP